MYKKLNVCGVIVTYNCNDSILTNVTAIQMQVGTLCIVDNNSSEKSKKLLSKLKKKGVSIIYNNSNLGIAKALNQGVVFAKEQNADYVLTMDQDSLLKDNAVQYMLDIFKMNSRIVSVGASYIVKKGEKKLYHKESYLITSGNLTRIDKILEIHGYNENLFIDSVDFDFSLSLRKNGGILVKSKKAKMVHEIGEYEKVKFICFPVGVMSHSPLRHYYMARNHIYIIRKYCCVFPVFCLKKQITFMLYLIEVLILHKHKKEKLKMILKGMREGIKNELDTKKGL